jgi:hypothetical protein
VIILAIITIPDLKTNELQECFIENAKVVETEQNAPRNYSIQRKQKSNIF